MTIARLQRGLWHLRHGTLLKSLQGKWKEYRRFKRRAWWCSQRGRRQSMIATIDAGLQMILYFDDELSWLIYNQDFERKERHFVRRYLRPGDVFVDAGANIGLYTLIAARCVGANGRVYSFEPCGKSFRRRGERIPRRRRGKRCGRRRSGRTPALSPYTAGNSPSGS